MEIRVQFFFRTMEYSCSALIDNSQYPCYIFTMLEGPGLISEFGDEITIATDGKKRLPKKDDRPALIELREAIFNVMQNTPEFIAMKAKMNILAQEALRDLENGGLMYPRLLRVPN
jgi:hypothetical protein